MQLNVRLTTLLRDHGDEKEINKSLQKKVEELNVQISQKEQEIGQCKQVAKS